jgi:signal transduction histidine kinase
MQASGKADLRTHRAVVVYLLAIVGPTLVVLYLGFRSVQGQQQTILRLSAEQLAVALEHSAVAAARQCLDRTNLAGFALTAEGSDELETAGRLRRVCGELKGRHPIARHFFLWEQSGLKFPPVYSPVPLSEEELLDKYLRRLEPATAQRFRGEFGSAQQHLAKALSGPAAERNHHLLRAIASSTTCSEAQVGAELRAVALATLASCLVQAGQLEEAETRYAELLAQHGDLRSRFHRPYVLMATRAMQEIAGKLGRAARVSLSDVHTQVLRGRWEMSSQQLLGELQWFQEQVDGVASAQAQSEFVQHHRWARALERRLPDPASLRPEQVHSAVVEVESGGHVLVFCALGPFAGRGPSAIGLLADSDWLKAEVVRLIDQIGIKHRFTLRVKPARADSASALSESDRFRATVFGAWEITPVHRAGGGLLQQPRETIVFAGITLLVLGSLVLGVILLTRDVSRETRLNRLRAYFVSGVSHELKTPLTLIRLYGETLLYRPNLAEPQRAKYCEIIIRESERLTRLVEKVLSFSRPDEAPRPYQLRSINLAAVVADTLEVYGESLRRQGFVLHVDTVRDVPPVQADPDAVVEAVLNLVENAAKYGGPDKTVAVRVFAREGQVVAEVEDHGPGIPPAEREKIFEKFYRNPHRQGKGGFGLGLPLVKQIMEAHGGRVEVHSAVARGSCFRLVFPAGGKAGQRISNENASTDLQSRDPSPCQPS